MGELADVALAEAAPRLEGNQMHIILSQRTGRKTSGKAKSQDASAQAEEATTTEE
jgi:hypothetical protein